MKRPSQAELLILVGVTLLLLAGGFGYLFIQLEHTRTALTETTQQLASTTVNLTQKGVDQSDALYRAQQDILAIQARVGGFEQTVGNITGTVGTLEKLSKTDPELLEKYSKVFFLNENYTPERLVQIDAKYTYDEKRAEEIHASVWPFLRNMLAYAKNDGIDLYVKSAYRSFDEQTKLKSIYSMTYGAGTANQFSADQGYSEHQLGTAVDLISTGQGGQLTGFEKTDAYAWMQKNAYLYGFVLSYPEGNGYYIFEPWHWRFVGKALALYLHEQHKNFYELEQRQIDEYLANIFDQ